MRFESVTTRTRIHYTGRGEPTCDEALRLLRAQIGNRERPDRVLQIYPGKVGADGLHYMDVRWTGVRFLPDMEVGILSGSTPYSPRGGFRNPNGLRRKYR